METSLASSAEATVSPAKAGSLRPFQRKWIGCDRSTCPPFFEPVAHQCATPEAAPSSISAPVANRSSPNPAISSCGRPFASVQAMVSPPAGIAL